MRKKVEYTFLRQRSGRIIGFRTKDVLVFVHSYVTGTTAVQYRGKLYIGEIV